MALRQPDGFQAAAPQDAGAAEHPLAAGVDHAVGAFDRVPQLVRLVAGLATHQPEHQGAVEPVDVAGSARWRKTAVGCKLQA